MALGWVFLACGVCAYGVSHFLQANTATASGNCSPLEFVYYLATHRHYWFALSIQAAAAVFGVLARESLPLFVVQSALTAGIGVTVLLGVWLRSWRLSPREVWMLAGMGVGLALVVAAADEAPARDLSGGVVVALAVLPVVLGVYGGVCVRRAQGTSASALLGSAAGVGYAAAAVCSRPLTHVSSVTELASNPLLFILIANAVAAQVLLAQAFRAGAATAAIASMDASNVIPASVLGIVLLGDGVRPGFGGAALLGFVITLGTVVMLARSAQSHTHEPSPKVVPTASEQSSNYAA